MLGADLPSILSYYPKHEQARTPNRKKINLKDLQQRQACQVPQLQVQDHALRYLYLLPYSACSTYIDSSEASSSCCGACTSARGWKGSACTVEPVPVSLSALLLRLAKNSSEILDVLLKLSVSRATRSSLALRFAALDSYWRPLSRLRHRYL